MKGMQSLKSGFPRSDLKFIPLKIPFNQTFLLPMPGTPIKKATHSGGFSKQKL